MPSLELSLNEQSFICADTSHSKYRPLCWIHFGGPKGANLRHLVDVSLSGYPSDIAFSYEGTELEPIHLGDGGSENGSEYGSEDEVVSKSINGPGGEYIQTVQIAMVNSVWAFKVSEMQFKSPT